MIKAYPIRLEVAGDMGMFARPDSGSEACSYPVPPPTACIGIIESVCRIAGTKIRPIAVASCSLPKWDRYTFNSMTMFRKEGIRNKGQAIQQTYTVVSKPHYQIVALIENDPAAVLSATAAKYRERGVNGAHAAQCRFAKHLLKGRSFHPVSLGLKEFMANYVGKAVTPVEIKYNDFFPSMLWSVFPKVTTRNNILSKEGVLHFDESVGVKLDDGILTFSHEGYNHALKQLGM